MGKPVFFDAARAGNQQGNLLFRNHSLTLLEMEVEDIRKVVGVWQQQYEELGVKDFINPVQIFENKGKLWAAAI